MMKMIAVTLTAFALSGCLMAERLADAGPGANQALMQLGHQLMEYGRPKPARAPLTCTLHQMPGLPGQIICP